MKEIDVAIIGGGPAGLIAGYELAQKGIRAVVFEEHRVIGLPIQCGEGVSKGLFDDFPFLNKNKEKFVVKEFNNTVIHFPSNTKIFGDTTAFMIRRDVFDQFIAENFENKGGKIERGKRVINVEQNKNGIKVETLDHNNVTYNYNAKFVIIAEGPVGKVAKAVGFETPRLIKALEYKIEGEYNNGMEFFFDAERYPYGYTWIFPRDGETNVGIVTTAKDRKNRLDEFIKEKGIKGKIIKKIGGSIPMEGMVKKLSIGNILIAGDTAGTANPIFYGGIRNALISGKLAGESIAKALTSENEDFDIGSYYYKEIHRYPFADSISLLCHNYYYSRPNSFLTSIGRLLNNTYINRIEKLELLKTLVKLLLFPRLWIRTKKLYILYKGFKIARDYGF